MTAVETSATTESVTAPAAPTKRARVRTARHVVLLYQLLVLVGVLAAWQYLPSWSWLSDRVNFLDPFFISSPRRVAGEVVDLAFGRDGTPHIWPYLAKTVIGAGIGLIIGMVSGALLGLLLSSSETTARVMLPFVNAINATPRVAFVPIIVVIFGPTRTASVSIAVLVVFFVSLFNAIEGGRTVPHQIVQNAQLFGASSLEIMRHIRLRYVVAWSFAALPTALAFSLVSVVTAEVFTGYEGVGRLLLTASVTVNADLTFALATYLGLLGIVMVSATERLKRRVLHWWT